ncbi:hypothetical protein ABLE68_09310 [Nocardioides sp. CN2-186]|uniref:hypothetical protein n=1 Tax=Nocardioides tweenelious TaxID=3156607 RepID=UPI0032B5B35F
MIRKFATACAALAVAAGLVTASGVASEASSFTPSTGHYVAVESHPGSHGSNMITFEVKRLSHGALQIQGFKVGHQGYGNATIDHEHKFSVCNSHYCYKGQWYNAGYAHGWFKPSGSSHWVEFLGHPREMPGTGMYMGSGSSHPSSVGFTLKNEHGNLVVKGFKINGHVYGDAHVSNGIFDTSHAGTSFRGFWHTATSVYGQYKLHGTHTWVGFTANAYDF